MTAVSSVQSEYIKDALRYANGMSVSNGSIVDDVTGAFGSVPSFGLIQGTFWTAGRLLHKTDIEKTTIFGNKAYKRAGIGGVTTALKDMKSVMVDNKALKSVIEANKGLGGSLTNFEITKEINQLIKAGKTGEINKILSKKGLKADTLLKELQTASGTAAAQKAAAKPSKIAKLVTWLKGTSVGTKVMNSSVVTGAKGLISKATATPVGKTLSKGLGKFGKACKTSGAGLNLVIEGGMALFTDVIPAFQQGGFKEGVKQVGKSAAKVGASTAGWVAGSKAGAAIGAAIGSIVPGAGTFIGGLIGDVVGGLIGSAVAGKVAETVVGDDYTDKVQDQAVEQQALMLSQDSSSISQINTVVQQLIQEDLADDGELTKDSEKMLEYLEQGAGNVQNASYVSNNYTNTNQAYALHSNFDTLLQRVNSGDTSVYDVPSDVLTASATKYSSLSGTSEGFANNYTSFGMQNPYANQVSGQRFNYFSA